MSRGEKAQLEIEPEWAYGKKGLPDGKYPLSDRTPAFGDIYQGVLMSLRGGRNHCPVGCAGPRGTLIVDETP